MIGMKVSFALKMSSAFISLGNNMLMDGIGP